MKKHYSIKINGKVQGVCFRQTVRQLCFEAQINGFVRNDFDGSVLIEAEADEELLRELVSWCYNGPEKAEVDAVEVKEKELENFKSFFVQS